MCVTICGRFCPDEGAVAGYGNRIRAKYTAKWGVQIAGMIFQTGSNVLMLTHAAYFTDQALEDMAVSYTHLRAHETGRNLVCRLLLEKKKKKTTKQKQKKRK